MNTPHLAQLISLLPLPLPSASESPREFLNRARTRSLDRRRELTRWTTTVSLRVAAAGEFTGRGHDDIASRLLAASGEFTGRGHDDGYRCALAPPEVYWTRRRRISLRVGAAGKFTGRGGDGYRCGLPPPESVLDAAETDIAAGCRRPGTYSMDDDGIGARCRRRGNLLDVATTDIGARCRLQEIYSRRRRAVIATTGWRTWSSHGN